MLKADTLARFLLPYIIDSGSAFGSGARLDSQNASVPSEGRKKLVVEFSSPNITNELSGKHLRSTIIGAFVSRLHESMGWEVTKINYLGDWGKNIALLKVGWDKFGNEDTYRSAPIEHLLDVYRQIDDIFQPEVKASKLARDEAKKRSLNEGQAQAFIESQGVYAERNAAFKKFEDGNEEAIAFWKRIRNAHIENYTDFYTQLGVRFDEYTGESQVSTEIMIEVETLLKNKGICEESSEAWVIHMQKYGLRAGTAIIRGRDGATTYLLRDLAAMIERSRKYCFDKMIVVAANDHNASHFTYLHHILIALGMQDLADKIHHLKFNEASTMADTLGKGYKPQAIIDHVEQAMITVLESDEEKSSPFGKSKKNMKALSIAALLAHELSTRTTSSHSFETSTMAAFKLGTGPDLQHWYAKLCLILKDHSPVAQLSDEHYNALVKDEPAINLLRILVQYPEVTHATYNSTTPQADDIVKYLTSVTEQLAVCLDNDGDDNGEEEAVEGNHAESSVEVECKTFSPGHLALFEATRIVLQNGLNLLGIIPYEMSDQERADTPVTE